MNEYLLILHTITFGFCSLMGMLVINSIRDGLKRKDLEKQMEDFLSTWEPSDYRFYGAMIDEILKEEKKKGRSIRDVAIDMNISERVLLNIKSREINGHRHISFYEAIRFIVACNRSLDDSFAFLTLCNFGLNPKSLRDRIIFIIVKTRHRGYVGKQERLDCIEALESNEPFNDNDYDYFQLFDYLDRQYS